MKKQPRYARKHRKRIHGPVVFLSCFAALLLMLVIALIVLRPKTEAGGPGTEPEEWSVALPENTTLPVPEESTVPPETAIPPETRPEILSIFADMAEENPDMVGWISIEDTKINYPLMYTPDEPEKYLHQDFQGNFSIGGLPFIEEDCSLDPVSDNLLIYGHNMANGTMFHTLMNYEQKNFWEEHPTIQLSTLYEQKEYEIVAALYDRIYFQTDTCFKFYQFLDAADEEEYDQAIAYFKEHALYDTGVTASYGDKLITLVTCAYHVDNGRFLVVAKEVGEPEAVQE